MQKGVAELSAPLATLIARLALTPEQIGALPDNAAAAERAGAVLCRSVRGARSGVRGFARGLIAAQHVRDAGPGTNSVFLVMIRLPGGRDATLGYLDALRSFSAPLWVEDYPNPALPQFPVGTQVALVRRALLVDAAGTSHRAR